MIKQKWLFSFAVFNLINLNLNILAQSQTAEQVAPVPVQAEQAVLLADMPAALTSIWDGEFASRTEGAVGELLQNVRQIRWAPGGLRYWVIFKDNSAVSYHLQSGAYGEVLQNVHKIKWSPTGEYYWVVFKNGSARLYSSANGLMGEVLQNVRKVRWNPVANIYWVIFKNHTAQDYRLGPGAFGELLTNVREIYWSSNGSQYWVIFVGGTAQMYNLFDLSKSDLGLR